MRCLLFFLIAFFSLSSFAQSNSPGIIIGSVLDEKSKALEAATVQLKGLNNEISRTVITDKDGAFRISSIPFGYFSLKISFVGYHTLTLDSIHLRPERYDFNLNDITLQPKLNDSNTMEQVIIYFEKPLIQSKDGNITFNAGESALSAGSNASDLLTTVPLITKDPDGKFLVRGKEPRILIDDKPVELNLQQLQDLLESMPGSSIEKIEVMTNPPPQYANEQGGVINIVTKKGTVGMNGRVSVYAGSRGEIGTNGSFNYRKQGLSFNINAGVVNNEFEGNGYSKRQNIFTDSTTYFNTQNNYINRNIRPNFRANLNYDINKFHSVNLTVQYNQNDYNNTSFTENINLDSKQFIYRLSQRTLNNSGNNSNPNINLSYTLKTKKPGEILRIFNTFNRSSSESNRGFYQEYFNPDYTPNGTDSTQSQVTNNTTRNYSLRVNYDLPVIADKTYLSAGITHQTSNASINSDASYLRSSDDQWIPLTALINQFRFRQEINTARASVKQMLGTKFSVTAGLSAENTYFNFNLYKTGQEASNQYWSYLPFANVNKTWENDMSITASYRKTIRRPGSHELNPTVDSADAYTIRTGNTDLKPSLSHNLDLVIGRTKQSFYTNLAFGYNRVEDVFAQIRTRLSDTTTQITWENISGRKEYEVSSWSGYTISRQVRLSLSASYTYNAYSKYDKEVRKYRDGSSFTSNFSGNYVWKELYTVTGNFTYNRFANPQGTVRSSMSTSIGLQARLLNKKLIVALNIIDPFAQQQNHSFTYGQNFNLENFSTTQSRNFRLTLGYSLSRSQKKTPKATLEALQKAMPATNQK